MSRYLTLNKFNILYPRTDKIGIGSYGDVWNSGDNVVKIQKLDIEAILTEIDAFHRFIHPCIIPLLHYSLFLNYERKFSLYMAFPKGIPIQKMIQNNDITKEKLAHDILSALHFLHRTGTVHADIKFDNVVFYRGHCCLIDFGLSKRVYNTSEGKMTTGTAYTMSYRDPEYRDDVFNPIAVELYPVAVMLDNFDQNIETNLIWTSSKIDPLVKRLSAKLDERETVDQIITDPIPGEELETLPIDSTNCGDDVFIKFYKELKDVNAKTPIESIFLACQLIHRSYPILKKNYRNKQIVRSSLFLAINIGRGPKYENEKLDLNCVIEMLIALEGIIWTTTILDFIPLDNSVVNAFGEIMSCHYRYPHYRLKKEYTGNKLQSIGKLLSRIGNIQEVIDNSIGPLIHVNPKVHIQPFEVNLTRDKIDFVDMREMIIKGLEINGHWKRLEEIENIFCFHYKDLKTYNSVEGVILFNLLNKSKVKEVLYWYFGGSLYKYLPKTIKTFSINPFAIKTQEQVKEYF